MKFLEKLKASRVFNVCSGAFLLCSAVNLGALNAETAPAANADQNKSLKIRIVNFKTCVEKSKLGQQEQGAFEGLKKQMETVLGEKEKVLTEIAAKFEDPDYLDSLSPEAETEIKRKFRSLNQELTQMQNQYYQALNQTNMKVVQKLTDIVTETASAVAKKNGYDLVFSDESCFFSAPELDISTQVITLMDQQFEDSKTKEKEGAPKQAV